MKTLAFLPSNVSMKLISITHYTNPHALFVGYTPHKKEWILNTQANSHLVADQTQMQNLKQYQGSQQIFVGNDQALSITTMG